MKNIITLILCLFVATAFGQDTTKIDLGSKTILIVDNNAKAGDSDEEDIEDVADAPDAPDAQPESTDEITVPDFGDECDDDDKKEDKSIAHWAGFEMGVNGFLNPNNSLDMENNLYDLDHSRSLFCNLNIMEHKIPLFKGYGGIVTGLGFTFNSYQFKGSTNLFANNDSTWVTNNEGISYDRNRLNATYIKVPLMVEFNTSLKSKKSFHVGFGAEGGFKLGSSTNQKFQADGEKFKTKIKGHYNLNPWRLNAMARIGYGHLTLFANYGLTTLFEKGLGPEVYPFEVGMTLVGF